MPQEIGLNKARTVFCFCLAGLGLGATPSLSVNSNLGHVIFSPPPQDRGRIPQGDAHEPQNPKVLNEP